MSLARRFTSNGKTGFQALKVTSLTILRLMGLEVTSFANRVRSTLLASVCLQGSSSRISLQDTLSVFATRSETSMAE